MKIQSKFSSRKFLLSLAAFLASIGGSITGIVTDNQSLTIAGAVCTMLSAAIYAALEAWVDGKAVQSTTQVITESVTKPEDEYKEIAKQIEILNKKLEDAKQ